MTPTLLASARELKVLANYAVGYNNIDLNAAQRRGIAVTNTPDVLTDATADLTWALLLAAARRVVEGDRLVRSGQWTGWTPTQLLGAAVAGSIVGIVGMGRIGQAVARRAAGFRMPVIYYSHRAVDTPPGAHWASRDLPELLRESDIVTIHVPLTPETRHLIGAPEFALMRRTAILINTARGPIVDESALVTALQEGTIAGAGLDVFEDEPKHPSASRVPATGRTITASWFGNLGHKGGDGHDLSQEHRGDSGWTAGAQPRGVREQNLSRIKGRGVATYVA